MAHPISEYVNFVDVVITEVKLPEKLTIAIEDKLSQEQLLQSFQYRIQTQIQEAERRRIEAIGIRVFYDIVRDALTQDLLTWRGIEATVQLARSTNTKIVIVGSGEDQLPLILGSEMTRDAEAPTPTSGSDTSQRTDPFDSDPDSFKIDPNSFDQLPDFQSLPSLFDESVLLPTLERAASGTLDPGTAPGGADRSAPQPRVDNAVGAADDQTQR